MLCLLDGVEGKRHRRDTYKEPDAGNAPSGSNNRRASDAAPRADRGTASPNSFAAESLAEYTDAPHSLTTARGTVASFGVEATNRCAPRVFVPSPIATQVTV